MEKQLIEIDGGWLVAFGFETRWAKSLSVEHFVEGWLVGETSWLDQTGEPTLAEKLSGLGLPESEADDVAEQLTAEWNARGWQPGIPEEDRRGLRAMVVGAALVILLAVVGIAALVLWIF